MCNSAPRLAWALVVFAYVALPAHSAMGQETPAETKQCTFSQADAWVGYWDRLYRTGQSIEAVKSGYAVHVIVKDPALLSQLLLLLRSQANGLVCEEPCVVHDARLVVEFSDGDCRELFVAEHSRIGNLSAGTWGKVDESFRQKFTFLGLGDRKKGK